MCNACNHSFDCNCGFGGDTGGEYGGGWSRSRVSYILPSEPISGGWAKDSGGTIKSYVNPNAHCPVCDAPVYFYRSPYNGRVFFDDLGWPWPKHPCTDNSREPRRATKESLLGRNPKGKPAWVDAGWEPILSVKIHSTGGRTQITGDYRDEFIELNLPAGEVIDRDSPMFVRNLSDEPDIFEVTFIRTDPFATQVRKVLARCTVRIPYGTLEAS